MPKSKTPIGPKQERSYATRNKLLDAAVDELLEVGYAGLTTTGVAQRAGVSRGAQQHHFPHKENLVVAALKHLIERQRSQLRHRLAQLPKGSAKVEAALDTVYEQYSGSLFAAVVELSLAARTEPTLRKLIAEEERSIGKHLRAYSEELFDPEKGSSEDLADRWTLALASARGVAILRLLGHPVKDVNAQWSRVRGGLVELLMQP